MQPLKRLGTDVLGVALMLASIPLAWVPGPGGLPLFLAGLGLLSINHHWARRLLIRAKQHGLQVSKLILRENLWWQRGIDLVAIATIVSAIWLFLAVEQLPLKAISFSLVFIGTYLLLSNRQRLARLKARSRHNKP